MGARADKRDAALVGADKMPTKRNEETNEAADESGANAGGARPPGARKHVKARGELIFSNTTGRSLSRR